MSRMASCERSKRHPQGRLRLTSLRAFVALFFALVACLSFARVASADIYVVAIGCSQFDEDKNIAELPFALNDVKAVKKAFESFEYVPKTEEKKEPFTVVVKTISEDPDANKKPTRDATLDYLKDTFLEENSFKFKKPENDVAIIYVSSHGMLHNGDSYVLARDSKVDDPDTWIKLDDLRDILEKCRAQNKLLIVDACHSAGAGDSVAAKSGDETYIDAFPNEFVKNNEKCEVTTFASCRANQASWNAMLRDGATDSGENATTDLSLFTMWLQLGLKGAADSNKDGFLSTRELFRYVRDNVSLSQKLPKLQGRLTLTEEQKQGNNLTDGQNPQIVGDPGSSSFILGKYCNEAVRKNGESLYKAYDRLAEQIVAYCDMALLNPSDDSNVKTAYISFDEKLPESRASNEQTKFLVDLYEGLKTAVKKKGNDVGMLIQFDKNRSDFELSANVAVDANKNKETRYTLESSLELAKASGKGPWKMNCFASVLEKYSGDLNVNDDPKKKDPPDEKLQLLNFKSSFEEWQEDGKWPQEIEIDQKNGLANVYFHVTSPDGGEEDREPCYDPELNSYWIGLNPGETYTIRVNCKYPSAFKTNLKEYLEHIDSAEHEAEKNKSRCPWQGFKCVGLRAMIDGKHVFAQDAKDDKRRVSKQPRVGDAAAPKMGVVMEEDDDLLRDAEEPVDEYFEPRLAHATAYYLPDNFAKESPKEPFELKGWLKSVKNGKAAPFKVAELSDDEADDQTMGLIVLQFVSLDKPLYRATGDGRVRTVEGEELVDIKVEPVNTLECGKNLARQYIRTVTSERFEEIKSEIANKNKKSK